MQLNSVKYTIMFAAIVCIACSIMVAVSAVALAERQELNRKVYKQRNVLMAAGIIKDGEKVSNQDVVKLFDENTEMKLVDLKTGEYVEDGDPASYNQLAARDDPAQSHPAPENSSSIKRVPNKGLVFHVMKEGKVDAVVVPIEGYGLWGTLYGYLALEHDGNTIRGITYYDHKETPGLGGEVDNPKWKALWPGRKGFDDDGKPAIRVIKGKAGSVDEAPHEIDGMSGATITSNGVTHMMDFWLGEAGYGPFLHKFREQGSA
ncbi:MAG: Na(+)-translocating NADH-quinone reductase subunit C [Candidatus Hydrogenedentes bacterium]|nr:Na(+)-translocating NADH-quinone reductase subunit C [Candidatus Hydrogenedentota bacterium]